DLPEPANFVILDTISAAHAEVGDFAGAIGWQEQAIELAPDGQKAVLRHRLELYRSGKPLRSIRKTGL
ncbi:MAG: hypothetical protein WBF93_11010, partial [Pirellulales bacterium]